MLEDIPTPPAIPTPPDIIIAAMEGPYAFMYPPACGPGRAPYTPPRPPYMDDDAEGATEAMLAMEEEEDDAEGVIAGASPDVS